MLIGKRITGVVLMVLLLAVTVGQAATIYVDDSGSDTNGNGSQQSPYASIDKALDDCSNGSSDVIYVGSGTYSVDQQITIDKNNIEIDFDPDVLLETTDSTYWNDDGAKHLFSLAYRSNIFFDGNDTIFRMRRDSSNDHRGHVLNIWASTNVIVSDISIEDAELWGIHISGSTGQESSNIVLTNVVCYNSYQNGIAVCSVDGLTIEDCIIKETIPDNTANQGAGIDFEPDANYQVLKDIEVRNCVFEDNDDFGIVVSIRNLDETSSDVDILVENCLVSGSGTGGWLNNGLALESFDGNAPNTTIEFRNCTIEDTLQGVMIREKIYNTDTVKFNRCVLKNIKNGQYSHAVVFARRELNRFSGTVGGVDFNDCQVFDFVDRAAIATPDYECCYDVDELNDVNVGIYVQNPNRSGSLYAWDTVTYENVDETELTTGVASYFKAFNRMSIEWYSSIQAAIDDSNDGDVIEVAPITHGAIDFDGKAITVRSFDPNDPNIVDATIIDGNGSGNVVTFDSGEGSSSVLQGLTITGAAQHGIYCSSASPTIEDCNIVGNGGSSYDGGGMYNYYASPTVDGCIFEDNDGDDGGGMYNSHSSPTVMDCTFSDNDGYNGGGMSTYYGQPIVTDCVFSGNWADDDGGGMYNENCEVIVDDCVFAGNSASSDGGGMYSDDADSASAITSCVFWNNSAGDDGGGIANDDSDHYIINCTFFDNDASDDGGAIYNSSSDPGTVNCIFWENTAGGSGDDIYNPGLSTRNNFYDDPDFEDETDPDGTDNVWGTSDDGLNLDSASDCIDEGDTDDAELDYDGKDIKGDDREMGNDPDMGAYECED